MPVTPGKKPAVPITPLKKVPPPPPKAVDLSKVASNNPDDMLQGGLMDDFNGMVTKARYAPWDYNGNLDHHVLGAQLTIELYDENDVATGDEFIQTYSAGDLTQFVPSADGENAVNLEKDTSDPTDYEGIYAFRVGKREQLNNNTNWAQFNMALRDAGFDSARYTPAITYMEGVYGHWNRVPQRKRSGITVADDPGKPSRRNDILVITELKPAPGGDAAAAPKAKPAAKATPVAAPEPEVAESEGEVSELDIKLYEIVGELVTAAGETGLPKGKIAGTIIKRLTGGDKAEGLKRIAQPEFLESGGADQWVYDADSGILYAAG